MLQEFKILLYKKLFGMIKVLDECVFTYILIELFSNKKVRNTEDKHMSFVLIVEPDEFVFQKMNDLLATEECEFEYQVVATPDHAMELFYSREVDVVVSEINMPIMSGRELFMFVNMISPDTVSVAITDADKVIETVSFMNECKVRKLIISPFHVVDDVIEPITAALEYKKLKDKMKAEEKAFDDSIFHTNEDYNRMENHYIENSVKYDDAMEVISNLTKANIDTLNVPLQTKEKMSAWFRMLLDIYVSTLIQSNGNYLNCKNTLMDRLHQDGEEFTFHLYKKGEFEIQQDKMKEITYILLLLGMAAKIILSKYDIRVLLEDTEKYYIIRFECDYGKNVSTSGDILYQEKDASYRKFIVKATEHFTNIFSYKEVSMTKDQKFIMNVAVEK